MQTWVFGSVLLATVVVIILKWGSRDDDAGATSDQPQGEMGVCEFWTIVAEAKRLAGDSVENRPETLESLLKQLRPEQIEQFQSVYYGVLYGAYTWSLWGAAFVIGGGCGDDGFIDFRAWLISEGRQTYESALRDPDSLALVAGLDKLDPFLESYGYAALQAYEALVGREMAPSSMRQALEPSGERWDEATVYDLYPRLSGRR